MALYLWTIVAEEKEKKESSEYRCDPLLRTFIKTKPKPSSLDFELTEALENKYFCSLKLLCNAIIKQIT